MSKKAPSYIKTAAFATRKAVRRISRDCVLAYAGQASFFLVISAIPFFLLLSSLLRILLPAYLPLSADFLFEILPEASVQVLTQIYADLGREANVPILSVTALVLLWASSRGVRSLSEGVRNVYGTRLSMSFIRKYLQSLLTTLFVMLSIACLVFLMLFRNYLVDEVLGIPSTVLSVLSGVRFLFVIAFLSVIFALLFSFLSHRQMSFKQHLTGAIFAALGWYLFSFGYTLYVDEIAQVTHIYGNLSAFVLLMLWVYFCMSILLIGAELNVWLYGVGHGEEEKKDPI